MLFFRSVSPCCSVMCKVLGPGPEEEPGTSLAARQRWRSQREHTVLAQREAGLPPRHDLAVCSQISVFSKDITATLFFALDD